MGCSQTLLSDAFQDSKDKAEVAGGHFGGSLWSRAGGQSRWSAVQATSGSHSRDPYNQPLCPATSGPAAVWMSLILHGKRGYKGVTMKQAKSPQNLKHTFRHTGHSRSETCDRSHPQG